MKRLALALTCLVPALALATPESSPVTSHVLLLSEGQDAHYRAMMPSSTDGLLQKLAADPAVMFYDGAGMPSAHQMLSAGRFMALSDFYNIAARPDLYGNSNRDFPWGRPAGIYRSPNARTFKFIRLPDGEALEWQIARVDGAFLNDGHCIEWFYPIGTRVGETLTVVAPDGRAKVFEVRMRVKVGNHVWQPAVYRPYPEAEDLIDTLKAEPAAEDVQQLLTALENPVGRKFTCSGAHPDRVSLAPRTAWEEKLPPLAYDKVDRLLACAFKDVGTRTWRTLNDGSDACAPTTDADYHIVSRGYEGAYYPVSREQCADCHRHALDDARSFDRNREWYGKMRGSDDVLSFHPFDPATISTNGIYRKLEFRPALVQAGLIRKKQ